MHIVGTAGHVDHGKSTLVRALTGTDPDRLAEEKERGLTIDLGFAFCALPSGRQVSFVDVPGHIRFVKNMLAGVGAVDASLFVVAAPEGWKPQSAEHLAILELLGISHGVVVLSQIGLVDDELAELARLDVADHVEGTFLEDARVIATDAIDGTGLDELRAALDDLCAATPTASDRERPRLWIDRSFAATGAGRIVTGTLAGGGVSAGDELQTAPGGRTARIRAIQTQGAAVERIGPGHRVALNLTGVDAGDLGRGIALVRPGQWHRTRSIDVELRVLDQPRQRCHPAGRLRLLPRIGRMARAAASAWTRTHRSPARPATPGCTCQSRCRSCSATASCCGTSAGGRPSAAAPCSIPIRSCELRSPCPTPGPSACLPSVAGWRRRNSSD